MNKSTVFDPEFFTAHAKDKVIKTPVQRFEAMVSRLLNATDEPMTKEQMRAVITKTVIKSEKKAA